MTDTKREIEYITEWLRGAARNRQWQDALCYGDGGAETDHVLEEMTEWKAADALDKLLAALEPFTFPAHPTLFQSKDSGVTKSLVCDSHVQNARAVVAALRARMEADQ